MFARIFRLSLVLALATASAGAMQTTIWVDKDLPGDDSFAGTQASPYATISKAVLVANQNPGTAYTSRSSMATIRRRTRTTLAASRSRSRTRRA
jgi:hypothetical protein